MSVRDQEKSKSVGWVAFLLAIAVAYFGWGFLAADFFQNDPAGGGGRQGFFENTLAQLPNLPKVFAFAFQNRVWLIGVIVGAEVGVLILWIVMKKLERELWGK